MASNDVNNSNTKFNWSKINPTPDPKHGVPCERSSHGLSLLKNGKLLFLHGGEQVARTPVDASQTTWVAELDDDEKDVWSWRRFIGTSSCCPPARVAHAQAVYKDSQIYIFGGRAGISMGEAAMNDLWKLDFSEDETTTLTLTWQLVKPDLENGDEPPEVRSFHKMLCIGSSLYVFGGCGVNGRLADIHRFDIEKDTWHTLPPSSLLKGRGGANFIPFASSKMLGVVGGFAGQESNDGHLFDIVKEKWQENDINKELTGLRPRSVCISASFPSLGISVIFGGEVDPSEKGHEGAGGFENDLVLLEEETGKYIITEPSDESSFPETRGWSDGASKDKHDGSGGKLYIYGGLSGNDTKPIRLDDLWCLNISKA